MRRLIVTAVFILGCTSPADPTLAPELTAQLGDRIELRVGEAVTLQGRDVTIAFSAVVSDSRCPTSVTCVWAGDGAIELRIRQADKAAIDTLHTVLEPKSLTVGGIGIRVAELAPYPVETGTIDQSEYLLTLTTTASR